MRLVVTVKETWSNGQTVYTGNVEEVRQLLSGDVEEDARYGKWFTKRSQREKG